MQKLLFILTMILSFLFFPYPKEIGKNIYLPKTSIENSANLKKGLEFSISIANAQSSKDFVDSIKRDVAKENLLDYLNNLSNLKDKLPQPIYAIVQMYQFDNKLHSTKPLENWVKLNELPGYTTDIILNSTDKSFLLRDTGLNVFDFIYLIIKSMDNSNNNAKNFTLEEALANNALKKDSSSKDAKIMRLMLATYIKSHYSKNEIVEMFINTSRYGDKSIGIKKAAKEFYNKLPKDLSVEQSASLAALLYDSNIQAYL